MTRTVRVLRGGLQSIVVDRGRFGLRDRGVAWCGAMDSRAYALANEVLGNDRDAAAIEAVYGDLELAFDCDARCALTGADCVAMLDSVPVASWSAFAVAAGARLRLQRPARGMRTIVAFDGGIDVPVVLGSRSTDLMARFGGVEGRALRAGDTLVLGASREAAQRQIDAPLAGSAVRVMPQPGFDALWTRAWRIGHESNRMGWRLRGEPLPHDRGAMRSQAVFPGFVQLPPAGEPIVLGRDAQTTGGYPIAGVVHEDDLWILAQLPLGAEVRFTCVSI
jgi:biotin-dependent carboxylase-like uncharacterized protein